MNELENLYAYPKEWQNYGDINPERHGGIFVKWDRDMWHIVETTHYADIHQSVSENEHMFSHMYVEPMDIWVNGNPYEGFNEKVLKRLHEFNNLSFTPANKDSDIIPESENYQDYVNYYLKNEWKGLLPHVIHSLMGYVDSDPINFSPEYWNYLEKYGINRKDF